MQNISIARWKGRIKAAFKKLLVINGLTFNLTDIPDDKWPAVFYALLQRLHSQRQKNWCMKLLAKSAIVFYQTEDPIHKVPVNDPEEISQGEREVEYWYEKDRNGWGEKILADADYGPEIEQEERKQGKRNKIVMISFLTVAAVIIASTVIYNLPYFTEKRAFAVVENNPCLYEIDKYINKYPEGAHIEEVMRYREAELLRIEDDHYQEIKKYWEEEHDMLSTLDKIPTYLNSYPDGRYVDSVNALYNTIWDSIITKYDQSVGNKLTVPGHAYVHDMLVYMKENNVRTVKVVGHPKIDLKEFDEYPTSIKELAIWAYDDPKAQFRFPRDLQPIKDNISDRKAEGWTTDIVRNLHHNFDNLFEYGLIEFVSGYKADSTVCYPTIDVTYVVKNQENMGIPNVWVYTHKQIGNAETDGALYMGIALDFTAEFSIPDRSESYKVSVSGDPGSMSFIGINPSEIYNKMCERCLTAFDNKIETSLGLAKKDD